MQTNRYRPAATSLQQALAVTGQAVPTLSPRAMLPPQQQRCKRRLSMVMFLRPPMPRAQFILAAPSVVGANALRAAGGKGPARQLGWLLLH
jgi:hypothetical protein